jgi:hypothetical protein
MDWAHLFINTDTWRAAMNTVVKLRVPFHKSMKFLDYLSNYTISLSRGLPSNESVVTEI